jgi:hypothetical protein
VCYDLADLLHRFVGATTSADATYLVKFRSYEVREESTFNPTIWQAAYAALADPNTLAPIRIGESLMEKVCISGEIGWSNPTHEVVKEFEAKWPKQKLACLTSLGVGHDDPIQVDADNVAGTLDPAIRRLVTDRERIARDVAYRFRGRNMYFRLNVERGIRQDKEVNLGDIETHTKDYICSPEVTELVNKLVDTLLRATGSAEWPTTAEHFKQTIDQYISDVQKRFDEIRSSEVKTAAQEAIDILKAIRVRARGPLP